MTTTGKTDKYVVIILKNGKLHSHHYELHEAQHEITHLKHIPLDWEKVSQAALEVLQEHPEILSDPKD